ncbi:MAG: tetratricopeptide repeat protein [Cyclobacteriaceae bacterium]|nr:tetratricopeptide repeat protein [Cyclobacteriaceae bacterium]
MISYSLKIFPVLFLLFVLDVSAQIPLQQNPEAVKAIKITLDYIYNFEFGKAIERMKNQHGLGVHPANSVINAVLIYWRDSPLIPGSEIYQQYEKYLNEAIDLSQPFLEQEELYGEGAFYSLAGYGLLTELYAEEGAGLRVVNVAKKAYKYLKIGKEEMGRIPDFYFSTGLYNYYREKYPELKPFYKSFMWLFERGDKTLGLKQLKMCEAQGVFARNEAIIYLYHLYLRYENSPVQAYPYAVKLTENFPRNMRFISLLTEVLVAMNELDQADKLCSRLIRNERLVFQLSGTLFKAIIREKKGQLVEASRLLDRSLELHEALRKPDFHYLSMIYATQARVADKNNDMDLAEDLYKKALKSNPYVPVQAEAMEYLNK